MKPIFMVIWKTCPYCTQALRWMDELKAENSAYKDIVLDIVDENINPEKVPYRDYYYVPSCYIDGKKVHEGVASKAKMEALFKQVLMD